MIKLDIKIKYRKNHYGGNCAKVKNIIGFYDYDNQDLFMNGGLSEKEYNFIKESVNQYLEDDTDYMTRFNNEILKDENIVIQVDIQNEI